MIFDFMTEYFLTAYPFERALCFATYFLTVYLIYRVLCDCFSNVSKFLVKQDHKFCQRTSKLHINNPKVDIFKTVAHAKYEIKIVNKYSSYRTETNLPQTDGRTDKRTASRKAYYIANNVWRSIKISYNLK